ncbi:tRNA (guanine(37)-N1)-methyltransferase Trm5b [uncultured archaeon]|nr:tRNA (guanine(37)-N1)-methyltransferase Trm5b [uncultured archaeon]
MTLCAKVGKRNAEKARKLLISRGVFDKSHAPISDNDYVYFPVTGRISSSLISSFSDAKLAAFKKKTSADLPGFDAIGDIAIFELPKEDAQTTGKERAAIEKRIAADIMRLHGNIKTVAVKTGAISGVYRIRKFRIVAGRKSTVTIHKEHGCVFKLDVAKAYFSPRLSFERKRISDLVKRKETVMVLFAGVGPFSIMIAKSHPGATVISNELNPSAVKYMKHNNGLNKTFNIIPEPGDARTMLKKYAGKMDRVIMPLPMSSDKFLDVAFALCKRGGVVHFYWFADSLSSAERKVKEHAKKLGKRVKILDSRVARAYSSEIIESVVDFQVI